MQLVAHCGPRYSLINVIKNVYETPAVLLNPCSLFQLGRRSSVPPHPPDEKNSTSNEAGVAGVEAHSGGISVGFAMLCTFLTLALAVTRQSPAP